MKRPSYSSSSNSQRKCAPAPPPATAVPGRTKNQTGRSPLRYLNGVVCHSGSSNASSSSCSSSSTTSIEAPRGCLRFFLSHSTSTKNGPNRTCASTRTPKSAPAKPSKFDLQRNRAAKMANSEVSRVVKQKKLKRSPPCLYQWQSAKISASRTGKKCSTSSEADGNVAGEFPSGSEAVKQEGIELDSAGNGHATATPISKRSGGVETGCASDKNAEENHSSGKIKTPPIQASVSPEIQCGSGLMKYSGTITSTGATADTHPCFGAGYVVSGVADRRKCRPRGILSVRENELESSISCSYGKDDDEDFSGVADKPRISPVPLPCEASVHWLLSPCNEEDEEQKDYSDNESCPFERFEEEGSVLCSLTSPSSGPVFSSDAGNKSNMTGTTTGTESDSRERNLEATSLRGLLEFDGFFQPSQCNGDVCSPTEMTPIWKDFSSKEERKLSYNVDRPDDALTVDSLGSGNVIQTPNSESSPDGYFRLLWANASHGRKDQTDSEIDLLTQPFSNATLSPDYSRSTWDPTNLNFRLDCRAMPSNSIDLAQVQNVLDSKVYLASHSSVDNLSQSNSRISWRDGLVTRIFEMDEYDFCKCMSDDEDASGSHIDLELHRSPAHGVNIQNSASENVNDNNTLGSDQFVDEKKETGEKVEGMHSPQKRSELAESISFDGGGLLASTSSDLDWNLCYKNGLFK
ncbi:uncharacterized protein LOC115739073 [Rhodamnia argentea]|uniref:Uncharacterized protein LOC115739073 n=1 Tax=Rhodamnia argentea TaxID=178133 RepID=A0ABM3GU51_9MYRT|nr:uncharacterized protein LOC115739073 [Rhodamnia argentea]